MLNNTPVRPGSPIDVVNVAIDTKRLLTERRIIWEHRTEESSTIHCLSMLDRIIVGEIIGEQANRYIGWVQACIHIHLLTDLEVFKNISRKHLIPIKMNKED